MVRRGAICVFLLAAAQVCGGCSPSVEPIDVAAGCPGQPLRGPESYAGESAEWLIDDFESGSLLLAPVGGRDGAWVLGSDGSAGALIKEVSSRCVARGKFSGHFAARGFTSWGNNWTAVFRTSTLTTAVPYDGSKYSAISFWAAFGVDNGADFAVPVGITTMDNAWNSGGCTVCTDYYGAKVPLTHDWQRFVIPFDQMAQRGFGNPLVPMRRDQMVGFIIWPLQQFDIWIDDVRFEP
jgi:hypothetical protein